MSRKIYQGGLPPTIKGHMKDISAEQRLRNRVKLGNPKNVQNQMNSLAIAIDVARRGNNNLFLIQVWAQKNKINTMSKEVRELAEKLSKAPDPSIHKAEIIRVLKIAPEDLPALKDWLESVTTANKTQKELVEFFGKGGKDAKMKRVAVRRGKLVGYTNDGGIYDEWIRKRLGRETGKLDTPKK